MERRRILKKKEALEEHKEICKESNKRRVTENFKGIGGPNGDLLHQGIWKIKKKYFPKIKPFCAGWKEEHQPTLDHQP